MSTAILHQLLCYFSNPSIWRLGKIRQNCFVTAVEAGGIYKAHNALQKLDKFKENICRQEKRKAFPSRYVNIFTRFHQTKSARILATTYSRPVHAARTLWFADDIPLSCRFTLTFYCQIHYVYYNWDNIPVHAYIKNAFSNVC